MSPVDETAETIEADYALNEEEDVRPLPDSYPSEVPLNNPTHRRLRAMAGPGNAYLFLVIPDGGQNVSLDFWGILPEDLPEALRTVATAVQT